MIHLAKRLASWLPRSVWQGIQQGHYHFLIRTGKFLHHEPEFQRL